MSGQNSRNSKRPISFALQICISLERLYKQPLSETRILKTVTLEYRENHHSPKKSAPYTIQRHLEKIVDQRLPQLISEETNYESENDASDYKQALDQWCYIVKEVKDQEMLKKSKVEKQRKEVEEVNRIRDNLVNARGKKVEINLLSTDSESHDENFSDLRNIDDYEFSIDQGENQRQLQDLSMDELSTIISTPSPISGRSKSPIFGSSDPSSAGPSSASRLLSGQKRKRGKEVER